MNRTNIILALALALVFNFAFAQNDNQISTDRPDQTESARTVPQKSLQIETGFTAFGYGDVMIYKYPTTLFRYGLTNDFELRVAGQFASTNSQTEFDDTEIGAKYNILLEKKFLPTIGVLAHWVTNLQNVNFKQFNFRVSIEKSLTKKLSIATNLGFEKKEFENNFIYTLVAGYELFSKIGAYIEVYGNQNEHNIDGGFTYSLNSKCQFDVSASKGIQNESYYISTGVSFAF